MADGYFLHIEREVKRFSVFKMDLMPVEIELSLWISFQQIQGLWSRKYRGWGNTSFFEGENSPFPKAKTAKIQGLWSHFIPKIEKSAEKYRDCGHTSRKNGVFEVKKYPIQGLRSRKHRD